MPKKANTGPVEPCSTYQTQGMHLEDKAPLKAKLFEAAKFFAQAANEEAKSFASSLFPEAFLCTHCGLWHSINWDELKSVLFSPGGIDFSATMDEIKGILGFREASAAGKDWNNNVSAGSDVNVKEMISPTPEETPEPTPEGKPDGSNSSPDGTGSNGGQ